MADETLPAANENPSAAEKFTKQASDLDALRKSVEDAASVGAGIWLSYIFALLYFAIDWGSLGAIGQRLNDIELQWMLFAGLTLLVGFFLPWTTSARR